MLSFGGVLGFSVSGLDSGFLFLLSTRTKFTLSLSCCRFLLLGSSQCLLLLKDLGLKILSLSLFKLEILRLSVDLIFPLLHFLLCLLLGFDLVGTEFIGGLWLGLSCIGSTGGLDFFLRFLRGLTGRLRRAPVGLVLGGGGDDLFILHDLVGHFQRLHLWLLSLFLCLPRCLLRLLILLLLILL